MACTEEGLDEIFLNDIDLLHPEVLSSTQLGHLLKQRNVPLQSYNLDKEELLAIFYRTLLPLPQREYRPNRRGQLLMNKRMKLMKKRKSEDPSSFAEKQIEPISKHPRISFISSVNSPGECSRLKPPPSPISADKKTIKLSKTCNGALDMKNSCPVVPKESKVIRIINDTLMSNAKISHSNGNDEKVDRKTECIKDEEMPPKKKHKPITWP